MQKHFPTKMGNRKYFLDSAPAPANTQKHWICILTIFVKFKNKKKALGARNEEGPLNWGFVTHRSKQSWHQVFFKFEVWVVWERGTKTEAIGCVQVGKLNCSLDKAGRWGYLCLQFKDMSWKQMPILVFGRKSSLKNQSPQATLRAAGGQTFALHTEKDRNRGPEKDTELRIGQLLKTPIRGNLKTELKRGLCNRCTGDRRARSK